MASLTDSPEIIVRPPDEVVRPPPAPRFRRGEPQRLGRFALSAALILLSVWMLWDFLPALVWAVVLTVATWPLYLQFSRPFPGREQGALAALVFTLIIGLLFLVPLAMVAIEIGRQAPDLVEWARNADQQGIPMPDWLAGLPVIGGSIAGWWQANLSDPHAAVQLLGHMDRSIVIEWARTLGTQVLHRTTILLFTLLTLFFLYRDGTILIRQSTVLIERAFGPPGKRLAIHMIGAFRGTVNGLVLVGLGEGIILGLCYGYLHLPQPILLAAATGVLAMIPFGAPLVFAIASAILIGRGSVYAAIILFAFGVTVVSIADHFVRPILIGGTARLPFICVLLGILGGLQSLGLLGLFIGPAILAALIALWREWVAPSGAIVAP